jgi:hypothetical protein
MIKDSAHRITELEFYLHYDGHKDIYTHRHVDQSVPLKFYFHKQGKTNTYKGGTYKGLDITFGFKEYDETKGPVFGGILIRGIQNISDNYEVIGPCKVVDKILELTGVTNIESLVSLLDNMYAIKKSCLYLHRITETNQAQAQNQRIVLSPRVGLSFGYPEYVLKNYRYLTNVKSNDKYKSAIVVNLYNDPIYNEYTNEEKILEISDITNVKASQIQKYLFQYKEAIKSELNLKEIKPTNSTIIQVMGFCNKPNIVLNAN